MSGLWVTNHRPLVPREGTLTKALLMAHAAGRCRPAPTGEADPQGDVRRLLRAASNRPQRHAISLPTVWRTPR